jgi:molybdopterin molybdotransferase
MAVSIEEALQIIEKSLVKKSFELIPIENSLNRVIAEKVRAKYPLPNFDNSAMDGYGVSIIDVGKDVKIERTIFAGDRVEDDFVLSSESCVKIMTGAKVPKSVNAIIPFEDVENANDEVVSLPNSIKPQQHIRKLGEDISLHETLIEDGERLNPYRIGILASQGVSHVNVYREVKVVVFATGKELKMHYENIEPHQLFNTNSPMMVAKAKELGAKVDFINITDDNKEAIKNAIRNSLYADLIVTSGGVSVGEADFTKESFIELGMETLFSGIDIKPGKPTTFGKIGETAILMLPGNPSAGLINFEIFGKSAILKISGDFRDKLDLIECEILEDIEIKKGKNSVILGRFDGSVFQPLQKRSPGMVKPLMDSNGFIILSKDVSKVESGSIVRFMPTSFQWFSSFQKNLLTESSFNNI